MSNLLRARTVFICFAVIGAILLIAEHWVHVLPFAPWLFLAACPLMHLFMHHGHSHHHGSVPAPSSGEQRGRP